MNKKFPAVNVSAEQVEINNMQTACNEMADGKRMDKINCLKEQTNQTVVATCDHYTECSCTVFIHDYKPRAKRQADPASVSTSSSTVTPQATLAPAPLTSSTELTEAELTNEIKTVEAQIKADQAAEVKMAKEKAAEQAKIKAESDKLHASLNDCNKKVADVEGRCNQLTKCCSEHAICEWSYQAKAEYQQYIALTSQLTLARRMKSCPVPKPSG